MFMLILSHFLKLKNVNFVVPSFVASGNGCLLINAIPKSHNSLPALQKYSLCVVEIWEGMKKRYNKA